MRNRIISLLLCLCLTAAMTLPVRAEETDSPEATEEVVLREISISNAEEFLTFAENCRLDTYSRNLVVTLQADIDLTGRDFSGIPIFSGSLLGNGHRITGVHITADGSVQGLFRYLTDTALVENLTVSGTILPGGSQNEVGALAGQNSGTIRNCHFSGTLSGNDYVGGIAGTNTVTGIIEDCSSEGEIHGNHFVGGIAGENNGVIRDCANAAPVNTTPQQNRVEITDITLDTLTNTEDVNTVTDIGGIAGISSGVIRNCENRADVGYQHMGYNIGGIAGTQTGYIAKCENHGDIRGRKEVGGIVGQMEPTSLIKYAEDTFQILREQLDTMSALVSQASGNAQSNAGAITSELGSMHDQVDKAKDAVEELLPDAENPEIPDTDTVLAALNTLSGSFTDMSGSLRKIAASAQNTLAGLTRDLNAISGQIGAMGQTLNGASENMGGTITDVSDQDTPELLTAKVEACHNYGQVLADLNAGGIAGAMAIENDLDILDDWLTQGDSSMNFQAQVRAVILNCRNSGTVTASKQNVGGITGWQSLGLVKSSGNTGTIDGSGADYAGGIAGLSAGYLRANYARCRILGKSCVGGIAGSGTIVTDSLAQVILEDAQEKQGAILGFAESASGEAENPISNNFYLRTQTDWGAIDGISYSGLAEGLAFPEFMDLEALPELFRTVTIRFCFEDGTQTEIRLPAGSNLTGDQIPRIPEKAGFTPAWEGLSQEALTNILFDQTFRVRYTAHRATIQSPETRDGRPLLLAEGAFTDKAAVSAVESQAQPTLANREALLEVWQITLTEAGTTGRFLLPEGADTASLKLLAAGEDGSWKEIPFTRDGSYLVFALSGQEMTLALVQIPRNYTPVYAAAACVLLIAAAIPLLRRKKNSRPIKEAEEF